MTWLRVMALRVREMFAKRRLDAELDDELQAHLELLAEEQLQRGMPAEEARRAAKIELGGVEQIKEAVREQRGVPFLESFVANVRFGLRMLRKNPGFTAVVVLTLALGVGANTAIFTVAYATLFAPLPYPRPDRLVNVWSSLQGHRDNVSPADFIDWKRQSTAFEELNAWTLYEFNIATQDRPEFLEGMKVTEGYYKMLGNPFFLGRNFLPEEGEPGNERIVILTYRLWRHLGANSKTIGQTMRINGEPYTVVGVLAPGITDRQDEELMVPLVFKAAQFNHDSRNLFVTGRLKPGVTIQQARTDMNSVAANEAKDYPKSNQGWDALVVPFKNDLLPVDRRLAPWLLLGAVGCLLLIACLNLANLLLANGITRQREVAVRTSLGAKPTAIFGQFLTESLVLAILGGLLGIAAGYVMLRGLIAVMPSNALPAEANVRLNAPVLLVMLAVTTLAGVLFGCAPAWYASRLDPRGVLQEGERSGIGVGRRRLRRLLVITEFGLALPLLAGAGLTIHSFWKLTHVDLGIRTDRILGFYLMPVSLLKDHKQMNMNSYYRRILAGIAAVPGVSNVCAATYLPLEVVDSEMPFAIAGKPAHANPSLRPTAGVEMVTPDFFQTFGIQIAKGRTFTDADNASSFRVAMVNEVFANRFLKGIDPLQQRVVMEQMIPIPNELGEPSNGAAIEWQIVGVFHTVKSPGFREDKPEIFTPFWQMAFPGAGIGVRTAEDPAAMIRSITAAVNIVDSEAAVYEPRTMEQIHNGVLGNDRFLVILFASFAVVGLLVAAVGIHGVTAFSVTQRSHEIAVRMALGATRRGVIALVVKEGLALACVGLGLGLIGAYFVGRAMQSILFGVSAIDFRTFNAVASLLLFSALVACYVPARRATKADPMVALRHE